MTQFAILRIQKIKNGQLQYHSAHVQRTQETKNADKKYTKYNVVMLGDANPNNAVRTYLKKHSIKPRNETTVMAVEMVLSASPSYFHSPVAKFDKSKTSAFMRAAQVFIKERYGEKAVSATLHLDESTPHIHVTIVPDVEGKLNCKKMFDRLELRRLQTDFAAAVSHLGLSRGISGSTATHESIKNFYKRVVVDADDKFEKWTKLRKPGFFDLFGSGYVDDANKQVIRYAKITNTLKLEKEKLEQEKHKAETRALAYRKERDDANANVLKFENDQRALKSKLYKNQQDSLWNQKLLEEVIKEQPNLINEIMQKRQKQIEREYHKQLDELKKAQQNDDVNSSLTSDSSFKM